MENKRDTFGEFIEKTAKLNIEKTERMQMKWPVGNKWHYICGTEIDLKLVEAVLYRKDIEEIKNLLKQGADVNLRLAIGTGTMSKQGEEYVDDGDLLYHLVTQEPKLLHFQKPLVSVRDRDEQKRLDRLAQSRQEAKQKELDIETSNKIVEIVDLLLSVGCDLSLSKLANLELAQYKPVDEYIKKAYEVHKIVKQQMQDAGYEYTKDNHKELDKLLASKRAKYMKTDCTIEELKDLVKEDPALSIEPMTL